MSWKDNFTIVTSRSAGKAENSPEQVTPEPEEPKKTEFKENITDAEIEAVLKEGTVKYKKGKKFFRIGVACVVISIFTVGLLQVVLSLAGIGCGVYGFILKYTAKNDVKEDAGIHIVKAALDEVFDDVVYEPDRGMDMYTVENVDMGFPFDYNNITSDDHIIATYHGVQIEVADVTLYRVVRSTDEEGNETEKSETVFKGMWLICDFGKELTADLILSEGNKFHKNNVRTDNDRFNKKFGIYSTNPHDAFYILTPHMMEYILDMDRHAFGDTYMNFSRDGKLNLAINTGHESFEIDSFKTNTEELKKKYVGEVQYIVDLIDELRLVDGMYK